MRRVVMRGVGLFDVDIRGEIDHLTINVSPSGAPSQTSSIFFSSQTQARIKRAWDAPTVWALGRRAHDSGFPRLRHRRERPMIGDDWNSAATAVVKDWDDAQQWSDATARHLQQVDDGRRAVELLRQALARNPILTPTPA
jgi:hypothetical protein